ncbi:MAG: hypothetical protein K8J31_28180 [Anaerolineae bacterium]|nr:hypothetical protein [Anaerolineae bacterium]
MSDDLLQQIQSLQFSDKPKAEQLLRAFVRDVFPLDVTQVELRPLAVSLNSFNGFMTLADGRQLFFKTHIEPDSVVGEYYNSALLAGAGYPIIQPVYRSTEWGKQLLIYEVVHDPSVFDLAWAIETGQMMDALPALTHAQHEADEALLRIYLDTLQWQSAEDAAQSGVHQLFYHRLTGGRLAKFYGPEPSDSEPGTPIVLPNRSSTMREVRAALWVINGQRYDLTLDQLIGQAVSDLVPGQPGLSIVGHGDAHNGNVFFSPTESSLTYFDPAFAGRHHPLLDLTKPLFHNVFAMWMYFPHEKAAQLEISLRAEGGVWSVTHNYELPPIREMFLDSKVEGVLLPILRELKRQGWLLPDWRRFLKSALFCCPFLTMNLTDGSRFPPAISLLGLTMAVEMGAESYQKRSRIDQMLDAVERRI